MIIFVAFEKSGEVRDAFRRLGHDAISCDLEPSERPGPHIQGDARDWLQEYWDLVIAHPPCTYLANSGVHLLHSRPGRWAKMAEAAEMFRLCLNANSPRIAVENPVMHGHGLKLIGRRPSFTIQPWQFGHGVVKRTCFWTKGLPPLRSTQIVDGREQYIMKMRPSEDRVANRSRTLPGIANAMAEQWGTGIYQPSLMESFR